MRQVATSSVVQLVPPAAGNYVGITFTPDGNYIYYTVLENEIGTLFAIPTLGGNPRKILENINGKVTFSPDGKMMAFVRSQTSLMLADAKGDSQQLLAASAPNEVRSVAEWNPDGKTIMTSVYSANKTEFYLTEVSIADGTEKRFSDSTWLNVNGLAWLSDGSGIIISARDPETKFSQIWMLSYPGGETKRITNDFSTYLGLSLTADNKSLLVIKRERLYNIWTSPDKNSESAKKITVEEGRDEGTSGVAWAPDGRIIYTVTTIRNNDLWIVNADGSGNRQLTFDQGLSFSPVVSPDGRYIVFTSTRTGNQEIWRMDMDGGNQIALTETQDKENEASVTPDGKWIVYQRINFDEVATIWKVNVDGGSPIQLTETESNRPVVSPDGKVFASDFGDPVKLAIFPIEGGKPLKVLDLPLVINAKSRVFRWTPDGKALVYTDNRKRNHNLWSQTLDNNPPKQLTFFESGQIFRFDVARNDKGFALSRGNESADVVMVSDFR
jgi:Tol biopolymer transport system component